MREALRNYEMDEKSIEPADAIVDIDQLYASEDSVLPILDGKSLNELVESIKTEGLSMPVLVYPRGNKYEIIAGVNRWIAAKMAGIKVIPVIIARYDTESAIVELMN